MLGRCNKNSQRTSEHVLNACFVPSSMLNASVPLSFVIPASFLRNGPFPLSNEEAKAQRSVRALSKVTQLVRGRPGVGTQSRWHRIEGCLCYSIGASEEFVRMWTVSCGVAWQRWGLIQPLKGVAHPFKRHFTAGISLTGIRTCVMLSVLSSSQGLAREANREIEILRRDSNDLPRGKQFLEFTKSKMPVVYVLP